MWSIYPHPTYDASKGAKGYLLFNYLGNNGKITVKAAQGIKLSKTINERVDGATNSFTFDIKLTSTNAADIASTYDYHIEKADGSFADGSAAVSTDDVMSVTMDAGDVVYITGIKEGVEYEVTERYNKHYVGHSTNSTGTITQYALSEVDFVNSPRGFGSLLVEKDVTHPFGNETVPENLVTEEFDITVTFNGTADDLASIKNSKNIQSSDGNKTFSFTLTDGTDILFTEVPEGVTYKVTESNLPAGYTLVTDAKDLEGTVEKDAQSKALLVNNYSPAPVSPNITLTGTKTIPDYTWTAGEFEVALQQISIVDNNATNLGNPIVIGTMKHDGRTYSFKMNEGADKITYNQVGRYTYKVYEVEPTANTVANIAYDKTYRIFTVVVTDKNADGYLEVSDVILLSGNDGLTGNAQSGWTITKDFTNLHMAETVNFYVKKGINSSVGSNIEHDSGHLFGLFASRQDTTPLYYALSDDNGYAYFSINVLQDDYKNGVTYHVREIAPKLEDRLVGMTYNTNWQYTVEIKWPVGDAEPTVTRKTVGGATLSDSDFMYVLNKYDNNIAYPYIDLSGQKTLNGGSLRSGDSFTFEAYMTNADFSTVGKTALQSKTVTDANGAITFDRITFDTTGTKYIVVKEVKGNAGGIGYDETEYHISLDVIKAEDPTGKTILKIDENSIHIHKTGHGDVTGFDQMNFDNKYTINDTEKVVIKGEKVLPERNIVAGEFEFGLYKDGETTPYLTAKVKSDGTFAFDEIAYSEVGSHNYTVKEILPNEKFGVTYDTNPHTVTVNITDDGNGGLNKEVLINNSLTGENKFTNHYNARGTSLILSGVKTLDGRELNDGEFTFELFKTGSDFDVANGATPVKTDVNSVFATNKNKGDYSITLDYADGDEGTHYYVLSEHIPADRYGVSYDTREYHITVMVLDNGKGQIVAAVSKLDCPGMIGSFNATSLDFGNSYNSAPAELIIDGEKDYNLALTDGIFEFNLLSESKTTLATVKNQGDTFQFPAQLLGTVGTHTFYVTETKGDASTRITFDEREFKVVATVEDNKLGSLVVTNVEYFDDTTKVNGIEFVNKFTPKPDDIELDFNIKKTVKNLGFDKIGPDGFEFELENLTVPDKSYVTTNSDGEAKFTLAYTENDIGQTYNYKLTEVNTGKANVKYSEAKYEIAVTVSLDSNNKLQTAIVMNRQTVNSVVAEFENEYNYTPDPDDISLEFIIKKLIKNLGTEKIDANGFEFELENLSAPGKSKVATDANGDAKFTLKYTKDDDNKTYNYKLTEVNTGKANVKYSTAVYNITVAITRDSNNKLQTAVTVNGKAVDKVVAEFENEYNYTPAPPVTPDPTPTPTPTPETPAPQVPNQNEAPKTGDYSRIELWLALLFVSGSGLIVSFAKTKKRKEEAAE